MVRKILIPLLIFTRFIFSQEQEIAVVVMNLFGDNFAKEDLSELTGVLEKELAKTGYFNCADRSKINEFLQEYGIIQDECKSVPWLVRIGKALGVDKVVSGSVINRGSVITAHIRTIDVVKQAIDRSATVVCRQCSIDDMYLKKMKKIARILAGLEENDNTINDSLFTFSPGPLVTLNKTADEEKKDISTKMGDRLFDDMWEMKSRRSGGAGMLLFSFGASVFFLHSIIWRSDPPGTGERIALYSADISLAFLSIPFLIRANKLGKGLRIIDNQPQSEVFEKGFKLGLSMTSFFPSTYVYDGYYQPKGGVVLGGFIRLNTGRLLSFQPELYYLQKRITLEESVTLDGALTMNYFQLPLLFRCTIPVKGRLRPAVYMGPSCNWLIKATRKYENTEKEMEKETMDGVGRFDIGFAYGFELAGRLKSSHISFEIRTEEGIKDVGGLPINQNCRTVSFTLGYSF